MVAEDWSFLKDERVMEAVTTFSSRWAWLYGSDEDAWQEAVGFLAAHPTQWKADHLGTGIIYKRLAQMLGTRKAPEEMEVPVGEFYEHETAPAPEPQDAMPGPYDVDTVARLVRACYGLECIESYRDPFGELARPEVHRMTAKDPSHSHSDWAAVADIRKVYRRDDDGVTNTVKLTCAEEQALLARYGLDMTRAMMRAQSLSWERARSALVKITDAMNYARTYATTKV